MLVYQKKDMLEYRHFTVTMLTILIYFTHYIIEEKFKKKHLLSASLVIRGVFLPFFMLIYTLGFYCG